MKEFHIRDKKSANTNLSFSNKFPELIKAAQMLLLI